MKVLLSIKPKFAEAIFNGQKKYEFRKTIFKNKNIKTVVVYASSPMKKLIGEFEVEEILHEELITLWDITKNDAGISKSFFFEYFAKKTEGYAIIVGKTTRYKNPFGLKEVYNLKPPQSFCYIK